MANSYSYIQEYDENGIFIKPEDRHTTLVFHSLTAKENYIKEEKKKRKTCRKARKAQAKAQQAKAQTKNDTHPSPSFAERQAEKWAELAEHRKQSAFRALRAGLSKVFNNVDPPSVSGGSDEAMSNPGIMDPVGLYQVWQVWMASPPEQGKTKSARIPRALKPEGLTCQYRLSGGETPEGIPVYKTYLMPSLFHYLLAEQGDGEKVEEIFGLTLEKVMKALEYNCKEKEGGNVVSTIISAYLSAIEMAGDEDMLKQVLLETGGTLLEYNEASSDYPNLQVKLGLKGEKKEGDNLLGNALMAVRAMMGGSPDPRILDLKGKREIAFKELTPTHLGVNEGGQKKIAGIQARLLMGKEPTREKRLAPWLEAVKRLEEFILNNDWWPFPVYEEVVLVANAKQGSPRPLLEWLDWLIQLPGFTAVGAKEAQGGTLKGVETVKLRGQERNVRAFSSDENDEMKLHLYLSEGGSFWSWYLSEVTGQLEPESVVDLFNILSHGKIPYGTEVETRGAKVFMTQGGETYSWDFKTRYVEARQTRRAFEQVILFDKPTRSVHTLLLLALTAVEGMGDINSSLNLLSNLWEREANYGHAWEDNHPTRRVRDNSGAPLKALPVYMGNRFGMAVENVQFSYELFLKLVASPAYRHDCYVDKNGTKLIAGSGAGAAALTSITYCEVGEWAFQALDEGMNPLEVLAYVLDTPQELIEAVAQILSNVKPELIIMRKFGFFQTGNDGAKVTKFLNRAQQGASWNEAWSTVIWKGEEYTRTPSKLTIHGLNEPIVRATANDEKALLEWMGVI